MTCSNANPTALYDASVLAQPREGRLKYFKDVRIRHPRLAETVAELEVMLEPYSGVDIVLLIGPTGVGKTALTQRMYERTLESHAQEIAADPGFIPAAQFEAPSIGSRGGFSWEDAYLRLLEELKEPALQRKTNIAIDPATQTVLRNRLVASYRMPLSALRASVESALTYRRTQYVLVDEAVHIIRQTRPKELPNQMDTVKSLSNASNSHFVLIGSYDLYQDLIRLSGQVARRVKVVHFRRYQVGVTEDERAFLSGLATLQRYLPVAEIPDLRPHGKMLMESTLGCFGMLKETLQRALSVSLVKQCPIDEALLKQVVLSPAQLSTILAEIIEGEKLLQSSWEPNSTAGIQQMIGKKKRGRSAQA
ncbi:MAG: ATP-binding protein [Thermomicrobiales bacterium]|jgi:hypothetical protein|nr:MAG: ATP-binding protein [Thermomicrobiales bacterium]